MSDTTWRELERRWLESGAPEDGAAYLRVRERVGDIDAVRVDLLAALGHPPACLLRAPHPGETLPDLMRWGREAAVRGSLAGLRLAAELGANVLEREGLEAVPGWVELGWRERVAEEPRIKKIWRRLERDEPGSAFASLAAMISGELECSTLSAGVAALLQSTTDAMPGFSTGQAMAAAVHLLGTDDARTRVRAAIRAALVPWVLSRDPRIHDQVVLDSVLEREASGRRHEVLWVEPDPPDAQRVVYRYAVYREAELGGTGAVRTCSLLLGPGEVVLEREELETERAP